MTLLLHHNLSFRLKRLLSGLFDEIRTVANFAMNETEDVEGKQTLAAERAQGALVRGDAFWPSAGGRRRRLPDH